MAAVYKALSKSANDKADDASAANGVAKRNKQRVLILSSRGVTYRYASLCHAAFAPRRGDRVLRPFRVI